MRTEVRRNISGMNPLRSAVYWSALTASLVVVSLGVSPAQAPSHTAQTPGAVSKKGTVGPKSYPPALVESGAALFSRDCAFCHGRDAGGGESGPDLTRSKLVIVDVDGDKIGPVVRNGRPEKGMPRFEHSVQEIASLMAFIHTQQNNGRTRKGGRKGVDVSDLQTGNAEAGK